MRTSRPLISMASALGDPTPADATRRTRRPGRSQLIGIFVPLCSWFGLILLNMFVVRAIRLSLYSGFETRSLRKLARQL
jgi:hypothetical protein